MDATTILALVLALLSGLLIGAAFGFWRGLQWAADVEIEADDEKPTLRAEVTLLGTHVRTNMTVSVDDLEALANGVGRTLSPMSSRSLQ